MTESTPPDLEPRVTEDRAIDKPMADADQKRRCPPPQYCYTSKAETNHSNETYLEKVLDLPLSRPQASIRLWDLIGSSLPLRKGLVDYLKSQRVPIEAQATPAIVAALGVPEPLLHARLEWFVIRVSGRASSY
ncbi:hypothetical protein OPQ81_001145 [Rhizoctonia solani]|nr:hypothetical protein OPQ81_001145 [Rhizoctonia solani]